MNWWSRFFRRALQEDQLEKELRFHLDSHESALLAAGHSQEQARRQARLALGGPEQVKERCRDAFQTRWAEELLEDTRYALRTLRHNPGFLLVTLLILSLGIGATTVMFAVIDGVLLRPLPFRQPEQLVVLHGSAQTIGEFWAYSFTDFTDIHHELRSIRTAAWTFSSGTISAPGAAEHVEARQLSADLFPVPGISPARGRAFLPSEDRPGRRPSPSSAVSCGSAASPPIPPPSAGISSSTTNPIASSASRRLLSISPDPPTSSPRSHKAPIRACKTAKPLSSA